MRTTRTCPQGHQWEPPPDPEATRPGTAPTCPVCGDPAGAADDGFTAEGTLAGPAADITAVPDVPGYEILGVLGRGGMGVVYQARQKSLDRVVALKMLLAGPHADAALLARFRVEAEVIAQLHHAHIVPIYEIGQADGLPYFALEFVPGGSLARQLGGRPQPPREAARVVQTLAKAMHYAHQQGVLHRDLKPANVLAGSDGTLKITDFGLAKRLESDLGLSPSAGAVLGTPSYMAPEQAGGVTRNLTPAVDVYALGAILYEMLTGRPPFQAGTPMETVLQVLSADVVPPRRLRPNVPRDLETICLKCLHKDRRMRYDTAQELADDLERFLSGEPIKGRPVGPVERLTRWVRKQPAWAAGLAVSAAAAVALLLGVVRYNADLQHQRDLEKDARDRAEAGLARQFVATWSRWAEEGDLGKALPWAAAALEREAQLPGRRDAHALRVACTLEQLPRVVQVWTHEGPVNAVAFAPDGRTVLTANDDGTARLWDAADGKERARFPHTGPVLLAMFGRDGKRILTADPEAARVWDAETGRALAGPFRHPQGLVHASLSPDGKQVATVGKDHTARVWDVASGKEAFAPLAHPGAIHHAEFSADGRRLVTSWGTITPRYQGQARIWDTRTGKLVGTLEHPYPVFHAAFRADGRWIATASGIPNRILGMARVYEGPFWNRFNGLEQQAAHEVEFSPDGGRLLTASPDVVTLTTANLNLVLARFGHEGPVRHAAFSADGRQAVTVGDDGTARVWDALPRTDDGGRSLARARLRHGSAVRAAAFSPDGRYVVTGCQDGTVHVWDLAAAAAGDLLLGHTDLCMQAVFSPDGTRVLSASRDGTAQLCTLNPPRHVLRTFRHAAVVIQACFSPDGRLVATASFDRTARIWDLDGEGSIELRHDDNVWHAAFSPDGRLVATACDDGAARVWDAGTGKPAAVGPFRHQGPVKHVCFRPDGRVLASAGEDRAVRLWDLTTGKEIGPARMHGDEVRWVEYSPDGKRLVSAGLDQQARLWDLTAPDAPPRELRHSGAVVRAHFSPDGRRVITCSSDYTARVWDAMTGEPVTPPLRHQSYVQDAAFTPDGRVVATAAQDAQARLWDAATGELVAPPLRHAHFLQHVAIDPAGRLLVTSGGVRKTSLTPASSGEVLLWRIPTPGDPQTLTRLAWLHCGNRIGEGEGVLPVTPAELHPDWLALSGRPAPGFETTPAGLLAWHRQEAASCLVTARPARRVALKASFAHLNPLIAAEPEDGTHRAQRAYAHAELGDYLAAEADYAAALRLGAESEDSRYYLALLCLRRGDQAGYRAARAELQKRCGKSWPPTLSFVLGCLLGPGEPADFAGLRKNFETFLAANPNNLLARRWYGMILYRLGEFGPAADNLKRATGLLGGQGNELDWFYLGMAQQRLGQHAEAKKSLEKALSLQRTQAAARAKEQAAKAHDVTPFWYQRMHSQLVRDEAGRVIESDGEGGG